MSIPLLTTKLAIPPIRPNLVSRQGLVNQLEEGYRLGSRLFLVSAPAGYGKTTLITEWFASLSACAEDQQPDERPHIGWVNLDAKDNDPSLFLSYLIAAVQTIDASLGKTASALLQIPFGSEAAFSIDAAMMALVNDLAAWPGCILLALDDYHQIESPAVHNLLTFLVDHLPSRVRLVIATRTDPPLSLPRLRARSHLTEIRLDDLRFSPQESALFLTQAMGLRQLSPQDLETLSNRTEGWITGLQLAALSLQGRQDVSGFIAAFTGTNRYILDYLVDEILQQQPEPVQQFLLQTSVLDRMCAELCETVVRGRWSVDSKSKDRPSWPAGQGELTSGKLLAENREEALSRTSGSNSSSILDYLDRSNLFLIPLDEERTWYRYHNLFAEFLRGRLRQLSATLAWNGPGLEELSCRASQWFEQQNLIADAIDMANQGRDFQRAAGLIELEVRKMLMPGQGHIIQSWLDRLPASLVQERPRLGLAQVWTLLTAGELEMARQCLDAIPLAVNEDASIAGEEAAARALLAVLNGDVQASIALSQRALELLPADETFLRALIALDLGLAYDNLGNVPDAILSFQQAYQLGLIFGNPMIVLAALTQWGDMLVLESKLGDAFALFQKAVQLSLEPGNSLPFAGVAYVRLGWIEYELDRLDDAAGCLGTGIELGQRWESADILAASCSYLALVRFAQGDPVEARRLARQANQALSENMVSSATVNVARVMEVRLQLKLGEFQTALDWAREVQARQSGLPAYLMDIEGATLARVYLSHHQPETALKTLEPLVGEAERSGRYHHLIELLVVQALCLAAGGQSEPARAALFQAIRLAAPQGYLRTFIDEGEEMRLLIADCRSQINQGRNGTDEGREQELTGYIDRLLSHFKVSSGISISHPKTAIINLVEPLSEREIEVLRLVAEGMSNQEVADRLYVAISTVKTHINNIYGKLGVKTRIQAVELARKQKILNG